MVVQQLEAVELVSGLEGGNHREHLSGIKTKLGPITGRGAPATNAFG